MGRRERALRHSVRCDSDSEKERGGDYYWGEFGSILGSRCSSETNLTVNKNQMDAAVQKPPSFVWSDGGALAS